MKKLSERETAVLRVLLDNMPRGSTGSDLVWKVRKLLGSISPADITKAGVHKTAAALVRKDLAWRAGTSYQQAYKITQPGRDVLDGKGRYWRVSDEH